MMSAQFIKLGRWIEILLLIIVFVHSGTVQAQIAAQMCIPDAWGVPGSSGPPDWWTPGQTSVGGGANIFAYQPFDPRWRGSMVLDYGSGSISQVEYRALFEPGDGELSQPSLLLSWRVKSIAQFSIDNTALYVGFYNPANDKGALLKVTLKNTFTGMDSNFPNNPPAVRSSNEGGTVYFDAALTTGSGIDPASWIASATPSWLSGTLRAWINAQNNPYTWTVQLRIPLDATSINNGLDLQAENFRMWHYAQTEALLSSGSSAIVPYTWPRPEAGEPVLKYASYFDITSAQQKYPNASTWGNFAMVSNPTADPACSGVYLANDRIGTRLTVFNSEIKLNADNTFFSEPENKSSTPIANNVLSATFRIANWGSQVGNVSAASWSAPTALTNVAGGGVAANGFGNIEGRWNPSMELNDICPFIGRSGAGGVPGNASCPNATPTRMLHQCILVELQGPGLNFVRSSASRNMNFVKASRFEREAEISVVGLPDHENGKRDVFLYVERRNMPRFQSGDPQREQASSNSSKQYAGAKFEGEGIPIYDGKSSKHLSDEELAATIPTWIVHAYHDSGEKISLSDKKKYRVLTPQTSFGYFVSHEGLFEGWADVITGAHRLREDLYNVSPPNNGAVRVNTIIQAVETGEQPVGQWPPPAPGEPPLDQYKWWWIVALFLLILIVWIALRSRKST